MTDETLNSILDIPTEATREPAALVVANPEPAALVPANTVSANTSAVLANDFEYARVKMRDLIAKGHQAIDSAILLAQSGDNPRAYEVVGGMIASLIEANKQLVVLHRAKNVAEEGPRDTRSHLPVDGTHTGVNIERAVFVGRTSDLLREIRQLSKTIDGELLGDGTGGTK